MNKYDLETGTLAVRKAIDATGYGSYVTEAQCSELAKAVILAVDHNRAVHESAQVHKAK